MSDFPPALTFNVPVLPIQSMKDALELILAASKQFPGGIAEEALTIASGAITPTIGTATVDTESGAAAGDLETINASGIRDGGILILWPLTDVRVVTVKHNFAGGGLPIMLTLEEDFILDAPIALQKRGSAFYELFHGSSVNVQAVLQAKIDVTNWILNQVIGGGNGVFVYSPVNYNSLYCYANTPPAMNILVGVGAGFKNGVPFRRMAVEAATAMVAPSTYPRIDTVYVVAETGLVGVHTGTEAEEPVAINIDTATEVLIAWVHHYPDEVAIYNTFDGNNGYIEDKRTLING